MSLSDAQLQTIFDVVISHAEASGRFEKVNGHEPKNAPAAGLTCAIWLDDLGPAIGSGLASTSLQLIFKVRIYTSMTAEPQDAIDPRVSKAAVALIAAYAADFELGATVRGVDLRGIAGTPLRARAGYLNQDNRIYRVMDVTLPLIVNDAWDETA